jgi:hypothetical protein
VTFQPDSLYAHLFLLYRQFDRDARASLSSPKALPPFDLTDCALQFVGGHGYNSCVIAIASWEAYSTSWLKEPID